MQPLPPRLFLFILAFAFLIGLIQVGLVNIAFDKLGLSAGSAYLLLMCTLAGSLINLPLFSMNADLRDARILPPRPGQWPGLRLPPFTGKTVVAINIGGAVVPVAFSVYLIAHAALSLVAVATAVLAVAAVAHLISRPIPGLGIGMPMLVAPIAAAVFATLIDPHQRAALAYIGGTLGVLIGADLLRLPDVRRLGAPVAAIGGGGTFDGVFVTGLVAVLLA